MYSAEDSLSPNDDNIYLGRWLQGSDGSFWSGQQHYLTECQNLFRAQMLVYITDEILPNYPNWNRSLNISGDAFFKYGLNVMDSLRNQDRFANFFTRQGCYQYRIAHPNYDLLEYQHEKFVSGKSFCLTIKSDEEFRQFRSVQGTQSFLISTEGISFQLLEVEFKNLSAGIYFIKSGTNHHSIVIVK